MKKRMILLVGMLAVAFAGVAQAETRLAVQDAGGNDKMVVDDRGFIGIGTNTPAAGLNIVGSFASTSQLRSIFQGTSAQGGGGFMLLHMNDPATNGGLPRRSDRLGYLSFGTLVGPIGAPTSIPLGGGFEARAEADWTATSFPTYYAFQTTRPGQSFTTEKMRITGNGFVGISTTTPTQTLEVNGGIRIFPVTQDANKETTPTATTRPACGPSRRGTLWFVPQTSGADSLEICMATSNGGTFAWKAVTIAP